MIAVDICNTLADINSAVSRMVGPFKSYPAPIPAEFWPSPAGLRVFRDAKPLGDAARVFYGLAGRLGGITYVTSRPKEAEFVTRWWLAENVFPKGKIIFCDRREKPDVYASLDPFLIAEDDPEVVSALAGLGIPVLVPQWDYNRGLRDAWVVPVEWGEAESSAGATGFGWPGRAIGGPGAGLRRQGKGSGGRA